MRLAKKIAVLICLFIIGYLLTPYPLKAGETGKKAVGITDNIDLAEEIDLSNIRDMLKQLDQDIQESLPDFSLSKIFEDLRKGDFNFSPQVLAENIAKTIVRQIVVNGPLIVKLLLLAILCAVINQLQRAFSGNVAQIAQMMIYLVLLGIAITSFQIALDVGNEAIDNMVSFMQATLPVMYALLLAMGNLTSAAIFQPMVLGSLVFLSSLIKSIVLPLFFLSIVLQLFNNISDQFKLAKFSSLLDFAGKFCLGMVMTVFIGIMAVQGVAGGVADGVALRTAKYSADLIPVVGKYFKDAVELVVTSGLVLKSAVGLIALLAIVFITLAPIVKIIAMMLTFKLTAALVEALGEKKLSDSLQDMSKGLLYIFTAVASVGIMFFMAIAIIIGSGDLALMLR
ncbi:MAG: stage III sporulation protein AE [Peptococcaceae bacterium]|nr:stage III sporulation protein AE [Peptococcaceae bacterium]